MINSKTVTLEEICEKGSSNIAQNEIENNFGTYPIYGAAGFIKNVDFYKSDKPYIGIVKDGAGVGRVSIHPEKSSLIGTMQYIFPNENVDINYLAEFLKSQNLGRFHTGATIPHIYFKDYKSIKLNLPSLENQRYIAKEFCKCNEIIKKHKALLEKYDILIKSRFIEMFGDPVQNPMGWKQRQLQDVCNAIVDCPHSTPNYTKENTGFMCIRTNIIRPTGLNWDDIEYISENEFYKRVSRRQPRIGDIVYLREGGILGIAAIINRNVNVALGQRTMLLSPNYEICNSIYVCETMNMKSFFNKALEKMGGSASPHINVADIKAFPISIPPIELQNDFAAFVHQIDKSKFEIWLTLKNCGIIGNRVF